MSDVTLKALLLGDDRSASKALKGVAREVDGVIDRLAVLGAMHPSPEVKLEVAKAKADLDRLTAQLAATGAETEKVGSKADTTHKQLGALATAVIALGPALVPLAAGATGLAAGWSAMGAAGVLAFIGVRQEMKAGTATGQAFSAGLDTLKGDLRNLAGVAAQGVLAPFQQQVATLQGRMPVLTTMVSQFSIMTGRTAANITSGLLAAFVSLNPLMQDVSIETLHLSQRFQTLMSGPGVVAFGDYARSVLPSVMATIESIATAAAHLVVAFAPLGGGTLEMIRVLSTLLAAIPVDVLASMATLAGSVFLGFRVWSGLQPLIAGVSKGLDMLKISEEGVATASRVMQAAFGVIGVAVAAFSLIMTNNAESQRNAQQATDDYSEALRRSNGVIDESIRKVAYDTLQKQGAIDAAKQLGINLGDVTLAATGNSAAMAKVNGVIKDAIQNHRELFGAAHTLHSALGENNTELQNAQQANKDLAAATGQTSSAVGALAARYGASAGAYASAVQAQQQQADAAQAATIKMQLESDAAGILKQSLDKLNGKALDAADAQNAFDSSLANMGDHVTATGKKIHFTTTSITDMSAASVALRGQLNGQIANLQRVVEANGGLSNSTGKAREQMVAMRDQIIRNAVAHGVDRAAVTAYIDKILKIPKSVPPTKTDLDTKAALAKKAALQKAIDSLHGKTVVVTTKFNYIVNTVKGSGAQSSAAAERLFASVGSGVAVSGHGSPGSGKGYATGGRNLPAGMAWVGEQGPELMWVPQGSSIFTNRESRAMTSGGGGGGGGLQPVIVQFVDQSGRVMQEKLLELKRITGGKLGLD